MNFKISAVFYCKPAGKKKREFQNLWKKKHLKHINLKYYIFNFLKSSQLPTIFCFAPQKRGFVNNFLNQLFAFFHQEKNEQLLCVRMQYPVMT